MFGSFTSIRFVLALITVMALAVKPLIPQRTLLLYPAAEHTVSIYGPPDAQGNPSVTWIDKKSGSWRCNSTQRSEARSTCIIALEWLPTRADPNNPGGFLVCEFDISDPDGNGWGWEKQQNCVVTPQTRADFTPALDKQWPACNYTNSDPNKDGWGWEEDEVCKVGIGTKSKPPEVNIATPTSIDASSYDGFLIKAVYEGRAEFINLTLRDADAIVSQTTGREKFMSAIVKTADLRIGPVFVGFNAFGVDEWWVFQQNPPRHSFGSEFKHLVHVGLNHRSFGIHRLQVQEIKLVGQRISDEIYLMSIMLVWIAYLCIEAGLRFRYLTHSLLGNTDQMTQLANDTSRLEQEKQQLENRSRTDPLTGITNRLGLGLFLHEFYGGERLPAGTGVVVLDIDHFKRLNDTYGHDAGDQVLMNFTALIKGAIRARDIFARWGGEEFVLILDNINLEKLTFTCEKLRQLVAETKLIANFDHQVTVSIGAVLTSQIELFDTAFVRADTALYRAKTSRNKVEYET